MSCCEWIICEKTSRWASALRLAIARETTPVKQPLHEVRSLTELAARLEVRPQSLAIVELHQDQVGNALLWLAAAERRFPQARFAAALANFSEWPDIGDVLLEAGADEITDSPRRLHAVLELGRRHAAICAAHSRPPHRSEISVVAAAWESLPWQDE
jgi:hypothetical protein